VAEISRRKAHKALGNTKRKLEELADDVNFLNITAMLDMMTIILVFLIKSWSVSVSNIQLDQLDPPTSTSELAAAEALKVMITARAILVEGEEVVAVKNGAVDGAQKEGGSNGNKIVPLLDLIARHAKREKKIAELRGEEFKGELSLIADKGTPYRLITEVLYTAGQAEYKNARLVVKKGAE
jgi:biopolymer transport protein ExbD